MGPGPYEEVRIRIGHWPQMGTVHLSIDIITVMPIHWDFNICGLQTVHHTPKLEKIIWACISSMYIYLKSMPLNFSINVIYIYIYI